LPVLGALFRSTAFQTDKSELIFVVTPRLAKVLPPDFVLPTDTYVPPKRSEYFLEGRVEGKPPTPVPAAPVEETPPITE
jgi:pilus assembly protein CpaC